MPAQRRDGLRRRLLIRDGDAPMLLQAGAAFVERPVGIAAALVLFLDGVAAGFDRLKDIELLSVGVVRSMGLCYRSGDYI